MLGLLIATQLYIVQPGNTLWGIAGNQWPAVCETNHLENCNLIYPGQVITINSAKTVSNVQSVSSDGDSDSDDSAANVPSSVPAISSPIAGTLSCSGLEQLWTSAGGNPGAAFMAAEIAMAESGGQQYATGPNGEEGYWQINPVNTGLATYDPIGNAHSAITLSNDGTNWSPWTTYTTGAYIGRCLCLSELVLLLQL